MTIYGQNQKSYFFSLPVNRRRKWQSEIKTTYKDQRNKDIGGTVKDK